MKIYLGITVFLSKMIIFDPFKKLLINQNFENYCDMMTSICNEREEKKLKQEFDLYLKSKIPENQEISVINFWLSYRKEFPLLSQIAIEYLFIETSSLDADRSFGKLRDVQHSKRSKMNEESIKMESIIYFNGDIENKFDSY